MGKSRLEELIANNNKQELMEHDEGNFNALRGRLMKHLDKLADELTCVTLNGINACYDDVSNKYANMVVMEMPLKDFLQQEMCSYDGMCMYDDKLAEHGHSFCYEGDKCTNERCPFYGKDHNANVLIMVEE